MSGDRGSSRVSVFLADIAEDELDALTSDIADLLVKHGLGEENEDDPVRSLIFVAAWEWPAEDEIGGWAESEKASQIIMPSALLAAHPGEETE